MANEEPRTVLIEHATLIWRNFEGREEPYNERKDRLFSVVLPKELADQLANDGWNVRCRLPDEDGEEFCHIQIKVSYKFRPPTIILISSKGRTVITEETIDLLDSVEIANADLIFREYRWSMNGKTGVKAYLQSLYVTVAEDELYRKYANDEEESNSRSEEPTD